MKSHSYNNPTGSRGARGKESNAKWRPILSTVLVMAVFVSGGPAAFGEARSTLKGGAVVSSGTQKGATQIGGLVGTATVNPDVWEGYAACNEKHKDEYENWVRDVVLPTAREGKRFRREVKIDCSLTFRETDVITKRLIFEGDRANGVTVDLNGATLDGGRTVTEQVWELGADLFGDTVWKRVDKEVGLVNYNSDMIEVRSRRYKDDPNMPWKFDRPENITIKNGHIIGAIRVWGMSKNGEDTAHQEYETTWVYKCPNEQGECGVFSEKTYIEGSSPFKDSSRRDKKHTERARMNAPTQIVFDNLIITGLGRNPVYFAPGVTHSQLINSTVEGKGKVAIYLDTESGWNTIKKNDIHVSTKDYPWERWDRPQIAIDGSSHNKILNNTFSNLHHGGIYFYRNCGEEGVIRHNTPSYNQVINNIFYYNKYKGHNPAVYLGSHDRGSHWTDTFGFCHLDDGYDFGSSVSNKDHATHNVVLQNQFYKRQIWRPSNGEPFSLPGDASIEDMIKTNNKDINKDNNIDFENIDIDNNEMVTEDTVEKGRLAGCYVANGTQNFIVHGRFILSANGVEHFRCNNGELVPAPLPTILSPAPSSVLRSSTVTFTGEHTNDHLYHYLYVGTAKGAANKHSQLLVGTTPSTRVSKLPTSGTIYVRYWTKFKVGGWKYQDHTYTMQVSDASPKILSPTPGATLLFTTATFRGEHTSGDLQHWLYVGTSKGGRNLVSRNMGTSHSVTVNNLPTSGIIYVRYWTKFASGWKYQDHTFAMRGYSWNGGTGVVR